jgi:hypothetical protein
MLKTEDDHSVAETVPDEIQRPGPPQSHIWPATFRISCWKLRTGNAPITGRIASAGAMAALSVMMRRHRGVVLGL